VLTSEADGVSTGESLVSNASAVATTPDSFVVVWHERDYPVETSRILGQRYSPDGLRVGSEFEVAVAGSEAPSSPAVAPTDGGGFVVVWNAYTLTTNRVLGQRFDDSGAKVGDVFEVSDDTSSSTPSVAAAADGSFVVAWTSIPASSVTLKGRRYGANGSPEFMPITLATPPDEDFNRFALSSAPNGDFVVAWSAGSAVDYPPFFMQHSVTGKIFDSGGAEVTSLDYFVESQGAQGRDGLDIVHRSNGDFVVVFSDGYYTDVVPPGPFNVFGTTFHADGRAELDEIPISVRDASEDEGFSLHATVMSDGGFVVVWTALDYSTVPEIRVDGRQIGADGNPTGGEFLVTRGVTDAPLRPEVGEVDDRLFLIWEETATTVFGRTAEAVPSVICGDGTLDGGITATDALFALQASIQLTFCSVVACDVDATSAVTATDALRILNVAVGVNEPLNCPSK